MIEKCSTIKTIQEMEIGDRLRTSLGLNDYEIFRVPGGYIYIAERFGATGPVQPGDMVQLFVPYSDK
jgi:hypothetical protein